MNKASGGDGISVQLFQILEDDTVKVLHSVCQQIWKTQQWPKDWKGRLNPWSENKDPTCYVAKKLKLKKIRVRCCHTGKREGSVRISILHGCTQRPPQPRPNPVSVQAGSCMLHLPLFVITNPLTLTYLLLVIHSINHFIIQQVFIEPF